MIHRHTQPQKEQKDRHMEKAFWDASTPSLQSSNQEGQIVCYATTDHFWHLLLLLLLLYSTRLVPSLTTFTTVLAIPLNLSKIMILYGKLNIGVFYLVINNVNSY